MAREEGVEGLQVRGFLRVHVVEEGTEVWVGSYEGGGLVGVD